jgi:hypothetical protein
VDSGAGSDTSERMKIPVARGVETPIIM